MSVTVHTCQPEVDREALERIGEVIEAHKDKPGSLIQVFHQAQEIYGYLPLEVQRFIAERIGKPLAVVSGVVSFYTFFSTTPRGEYTIRVCLGTACYARGGKKVLDHQCSRLAVQPGETTGDGKFTFEIARCIGSCGLPPAMLIDDTVYKQVNVNKIEKILNKY